MTDPFEREPAVFSAARRLPAAGALVLASLVIGVGVSALMFFKERQTLARAVAAEKELSKLRHEAEQIPGLLFAAQGLRSKRHTEGPNPSKLREEESMYREALALSRNVYGNDHNEVVYTLANLGSVVGAEGRLSEAERCYREALAIREQHQDYIEIAWTAFRLGVLLSAQGEYATSRDLLNRALEAAGAIEYTQGVLLAELGMADASYLRGDVTSAAQAYLEARQLARVVEDAASESFALGGLTQLAAEAQHEDEASGWLAAQAETGSRMSLQARASLLRSRSAVAQLHRYEAEAAARRRGALLLYHHMGDIRAVIEQLEELARHAGQFEDLPRAAGLLSAAETLRRRTGLRSPTHATEKLTLVRQQIDQSLDPKVRDAVITGQTASLSAAVALGLRVGRG